MLQPAVAYCFDAGPESLPEPSQKVASCISGQFLRRCLEPRVVMPNDDDPLGRLVKEVSVGICALLLSATTGASWGRCCKYAGVLTWLHSEPLQRWVLWG